MYSRLFLLLFTTLLLGVQINGGDFQAVVKLKECRNSTSLCVETDHCSNRNIPRPTDACPVDKGVCCPKEYVVIPLEKIEIITSATILGSNITASDVTQESSDDNSTCIPKSPTMPPRAAFHTSCIADDGSRGFWPTRCEHMGIGPRFGCSCIKLAECRSNTHYCVYEKDCAVLTLKRRDDNCPLNDLKCCPKSATREQITPYIDDSAFIPSSSSTDNQLPVTITTTTEDPKEKPLPSVNPTSVLPPVVVKSTTRASNITASDVAPLSESFVYTACGKRAKDGLVPQKMREQQDRAEYGEIPWMAAIFQIPIDDNDSENFRYCCNGALISERAVLTTAHCVSICGGKVEKILVRLGEWDLNSDIEPISPKEVRVRNAHKHKHFSIHSHVNNIAVLELDSVVQYGPTIQPVCLPEKDYSSLGSREIMIFNGWGKTVIDTTSNNEHNFLKSVILRKNELGFCRPDMKWYRLSHDFELHASFVCGTKVYEEKPCRGDAGAPVVVEVPYSEDRYYIHGLVAWGYDCCRRLCQNTVLTNVRGFRLWINNTLANITNNQRTK